MDTVVAKNRLAKQARFHSGNVILMRFFFIRYVNFKIRIVNKDFVS